MTSPFPGPSDFQNVIPPQFAAAIIQEATHQSAALTLGNRVPMSTHTNVMVIPGRFPVAQWSNVRYGARKPYTTASLDTISITAEEIAATMAIPDSMADDSQINLWNYCRPRLAEAFATAIDQAVFFGIGAPASFPAGGLAGQAQEADAGRDVIDTINNALSLVEVQGLNVTGQVADIGVKGRLRGVRDDNGGLLLGVEQAESGPLSTIYGIPAAFVPLDRDGSYNYVAGAFNNLMIGMRQDIRYEVSNTAVLTNADGTVALNAFQDNQTVIKAWMRLAVGIVRPRTVRTPGGAIPFARAAIVGGPSIPPEAMDTSGIPTGPGAPGATTVPIGPGGGSGNGGNGNGGEEIEPGSAQAEPRAASGRSGKSSK